MVQTLDENPDTNRKFNNQLTTQRRRQNFDNTTIADRIMTVNWSNNNHPNDVVKPVYGYPTFPLTTKGNTHLEWISRL